jgi:hypothetical protein
MIFYLFICLFVIASEAKQSSIFVCYFLFFWIASGYAPAMTLFFSIDNRRLTIIYFV